MKKKLQRAKIQQNPVYMYMFKSERRKNIQSLIVEVVKIIPEVIKKDLLKSFVHTEWLTTVDSEIRPH